MSWARQLGEGSYLASGDRVTRVGERTFSPVNSSDRPPDETAKLHCARIQSSCSFAQFVVNLFPWSTILLELWCSLIILRKKGKNLESDVYYPCSIWEAFTRQNPHHSQRTNLEPRSHSVTGNFFSDRVRSGYEITNGHYRLKENGFSFKLQITAPLRWLSPISRFENATIL